MVYKYLCSLDSNKIINYIPQKNTPFIAMIRERIDASRILISKENYTTRRKQYETQIQSVIGYATTSSVCRSQQLLAYFGEKNSTRCGFCDVCEELNDMGLSNMEFERIKGDIKALLTISPLMKHELFFKLKGKEESTQIVIRWLLDNEKIIERIDGKIEWCCKED